MSAIDRFVGRCVDWRRSLLSLLLLAVVLSGRVKAGLLYCPVLLAHLVKRKIFLSIAALVICLL